MDRLSKSFAWLNAAQFLGALNDNVLKFFIIFFLIGMKGAASAGAVSATAGAVFVVPFLLFTAWAGSLADRVSKRNVIVAVKLVETVVTSLAVAAFYFRSEAALYAVLFLMATHSAFFGPAKYGIVPEITPRESLSRANGYLGSFTFLAIITGSALAPTLAQATSSNYALAGLFCVAVAFSGFLTTRNIEITPAAAPDSPFSFFIARDVASAIGEIRRDRSLLLAVLGSAYFWFIGAFIQINVIPYGMERLGLTQEQSGYLFFVGALAIGIGSLVAGRLSGRGVEFGIVPVGALGITVSSIGLHLVPAALPPVVAMIFLLGFSSGLFIVPLQTFIQLRSPENKRGEIIAASGFLTWIGVLLAAGMTYGFAAYGVSAGSGFLAVGVLTVGLTAIAVKSLPDFLVRFIIVVITRLLYRIRVTGEENIPLDGPALLVPNHVSYVDSLIISAVTNRRVRFIMDRDIYNGRLNPFFRLMQVIPVSEKDGKRELITFVKQAKAALADGYILCIFAEGTLTRDGNIHEFKSGFELIVRNTDCPVIPMHLGGLWGSIFSRAHRPLVSTWPSEVPRRSSVIIGAPMAPTAKAAEVRQAVCLLSTGHFIAEKKPGESLGMRFIASARKNWGREAVSDTTGRRLTYGSMLTAAGAISAEVAALAGGSDNVGILMPSSVGGALANLAVMLAGKIPVNLNYTASSEAIASAVRLCDIRTVITSKAFMERLPGLPRFEGTVYMEDIRARITGIKRPLALIKARLLPARLFRCGAKGPDDVAAILFSSGSAGMPKGIMLTHHNVCSNIDALRMVMRMTHDDNIAAALPFFHSLGFTGTLWLPLIAGFPAVYHTSPLDGAKVAEVVRENRSTLMFATPTFLLLYCRAAKPEDFRTLRFVLAGAEKLSPRVAAMFERRFGVKAYEGYGATELSPLVSVNLPDVPTDDGMQVNSVEGSAGRPVPGVSIRVVDPDTGDVLPVGESGLLLVKGPNVMAGYYHRPDLTADAITDGWYVTGDIGHMDAAGFVYITDRLSRFSKIGGEMVSHSAVEAEFDRAFPEAGRIIAVTGVSDEKKGERLVVVYKQDATDAETLRRVVAESGIPNLWKPCRDCYVGVDALPILGSGKLDLQALKRIAGEGA